MNSSCGRRADEHVRVAQVEADVAAPAALGAQHVDDVRGSRNVWPNTSRPQPQSSTTSRSHPAGEVLGAFPARSDRCAGRRARSRPPGEPPRVARALGHGRPAQRIPWLCSHSSSRPSCQSLLPRSGVSSPLGSARSCLDVRRPEQPALPGRVRACKRVADPVEHLALQVRERRAPGSSPWAGR